MILRVLVLEDEESIRSFIQLNLYRNGFEVVEASTGEEALQALDMHSPIDIAILDVMLPGELDGFEICQHLRSRDSRMGIIMLTARGMEGDRVKGLDYGADDYVVKPFSPLELVARVRALSRRLDSDSVAETSGQLISGPFTLNLQERTLLKSNQEIALTPREFSLIHLLVREQGRAISRDEILNRIWGEEYYGDVKTVDVNIRRLRQKIEDDPSQPTYLETVWGYGYRWRKDD